MPDESLFSRSGVGQDGLKVQSHQPSWHRQQGQLGKGGMQGSLWEAREWTRLPEDPSVHPERSLCPDSRVSSRGSCSTGRRVSKASRQVCSTEGNQERLPGHLAGAHPPPRRAAGWQNVTGTWGSPENPHRCLLDFPPPKRASCSPGGPNEPGPAPEGASRGPPEEEVSAGAAAPLLTEMETAGHRFHTDKPHELQAWSPENSKRARSRAVHTAPPRGAPACPLRPAGGVPSVGDGQRRKAGR